MIRTLVKSGGARLATLPVSALFAFLTSYLVISRFGTETYAQYGLLVGVIALFPFTDLGIGAALTNALAQSAEPDADSHVRRVVLSSLRALFASGIVFVLVGVVIASLGLWPTVLGSAGTTGGTSLAATVCWIVFAVSIPLSIGQRMLLGLNRNHVQILVQSLQPPLTAASIWAVSYVSTDAMWPPILLYCSMAVTSGVSLILAGRIVPNALGWAMGNLVKFRAVVGASVWGVAAPMLIIMVTLPFGIQSARLLLSHLGSTAEVAQYNLASQLFSPVLAVMAAASAALWPIYARQRTQGVKVQPRVVRVALVISVLALTIGIVMASLSPWLASVISSDQIKFPLILPIAFCAFVAIQSLQASLGNFLTDARGLWAQAICSIVLLPVNLGLSIWLITPLGAAGPVIASTICVGLIQAVPSLILVTLRKREFRAGLSNTNPAAEVILPR